MTRRDFSIFGHHSKGEGGDFIFENINKRIQNALVFLLKSLVASFDILTKESIERLILIRSARVAFIVYGTSS